MADMVRVCRKEGLKFGFYFSLTEWEYPLIGKDGKLENKYADESKKTALVSLGALAGGDMPIALKIKLR